eukprot:jgi/Chlat1/2991/Chrsp2S04714
MDALIEPERFDVIVLGTGLSESMLAGAAAKAGKSVLHLDHAESYGSAWGAMPLEAFQHWVSEGGKGVAPSGARAPLLAALSATGEGHENGNPSQSLDEAMATAAAVDVAGLAAVPVGVGEDIYTNFEVWQPPVQPSTSTSPLPMNGASQPHAHPNLGPSRAYSIDLAGPKLALSAGASVDVLVRSGAHQYLEFKAVEGTHLWTANGLQPVPASRADVFKDRSLSAVEKRHLMRFLKTSAQHAETVAASDASTRADTGASASTSEPALQGSFSAYLTRHNLPASVQAFVLHAICMLEQQGGGDISAEDGLRKLGVYLQSIGRFGAEGAWLVPFYGLSEMPQAFCRVAAVHGALYVLRRQVDAILVDKESGACRGVLTSSGQLLHADTVIANETYLRGFSTRAQTTLQATQRVSHCICIGDGSVTVGQSTILMVFPPHSLPHNNSYAIRASQLGEACAVCPPGKYIAHLSVRASDTDTSTSARDDLQPAVDALFETDGSTPEGSKPRLLWSAFYNQALPNLRDSDALPANLFATELPDQVVGLCDVVKRVEQLFARAFPGAEFFPRPAESSNPGDDDESDDDAESRLLAQMAEIDPAPSSLNQVHSTVVANPDSS